MLRNMFARSQNSPVKSLTPRDYQEQFGAGAAHFLLDVRTVSEFTDARLAASVNIPLNQLPAHTSQLPKDQPIIVVCRSGSRSRHAAQMLTQAGLSDVYNLQGGLLAWARHGNPLER